MGYQDQLPAEFASTVADRFCCGQCSYCTKKMYYYEGKCYSSCDMNTNVQRVFVQDQQFNWECRSCGVYHCEQCYQSSALPLICTQCGVGYTLSLESNQCEKDSVVPQPSPSPSLAPSPAPTNGEDVNNDIPPNGPSGMTDVEVQRQQKVRKKMTNDMLLSLQSIVNITAQQAKENMEDVANIAKYPELLDDTTKNVALEAIALTLTRTIQPPALPLGVLSTAAAVTSSLMKNHQDEERLRRVKVVIDQIALSLFLSVTVDGPQKSLTTDMFVLSVKSTTGLGKSAAIQLSMRESIVSFPPNLGAVAVSSLTSTAVVDIQGISWSKNIYEDLLNAKRQNNKEVEQQRRRQRQRQRLLQEDEKDEPIFLLETDVLSVVLWHNGRRLDVKDTKQLMSFTMSKHPAKKMNRRRRRTSSSVSSSSSSSTSLKNYTCANVGDIFTVSCINNGANTSFGYAESLETSVESTKSFSTASCSKDMATFGFVLSFFALAMGLCGIVHGVIYRDWNFEQCRTICCCECCPFNCRPKHAATASRRSGRRGGGSDRNGSNSSGGRPRGADLVQARVNQRTRHARAKFVSVQRRAYLGGSEKYVQPSWERKRKRYDGGLIFLILGSLLSWVVLLGHTVLCEHYNDDVVEGIYALSLFTVLFTYSMGGALMVLSLYCSCRKGCFCCNGAGETPNTTRQKRKDDGVPLCIYLIFLMIPTLWFSTTNVYENQMNIFGSNHVGGPRAMPEDILALDNNNMVECRVGGDVIVHMECDPVDSMSNTSATTKTKRTRHNVTQCVYWDNIKRDWSSEGCQVLQENDLEVVCGCDHLTDFSSGFGETVDVLGRVFTPNYINELFMVHWYVVVVILFILSVFILLGFYGNSHDKRVWRRESMEGAILASLVAGKMLRKMKERKIKRDSLLETKLAELAVLELEIEQKESLLAKRDLMAQQVSLVAPVKKIETARCPEAIIVGIPSVSIAPTRMIPRLSSTTLNQPWYKEYRRVSMYSMMSSIDLSEEDANTNRQPRSCFERCATLPRLFCTLLCCSCCNKLLFVFWHRLLHEHDILELFFVNNRWYTRTHRTMVLLTRIAGKFAVCGVFFLWSRSFGGFSDVVTGEIDWLGKTVAVLCSFTTNKTLGSMFRGLFVFLSHRHRTAVYKQYMSHQVTLQNVEDDVLSAASSASSAFEKSKKAMSPSNIVQKTVNRTLMKMEAEAIVAKSRGEYDAGKCMNLCLHCVCRSCTKTHCGRVTTDIIVWCASIIIVGFLLFFCVGFGFALQGEDRVRAWLQSSLISLTIWFFGSRPLSIFVKSILQLHGTKCKAVCCCCFHCCTYVCHQRYQHDDDDGDNDNEQMKSRASYGTSQKKKNEDAGRMALEMTTLMKEFSNSMPASGNQTLRPRKVEITRKKKKEHVVRASVVKGTSAVKKKTKQGGVVDDGEKEQKEQKEKKPMIDTTKKNEHDSRSKFNLDQRIEAKFIATHQKAFNESKIHVEEKRRNVAVAMVPSKSRRQSIEEAEDEVTF